MSLTMKGLLATVQNTASFARQMVQNILGVLNGNEGRCPFFEVEQGPQKGTQFKINGVHKRFTIGRAKECDFQLTDADVSRSHLEIVFDGQVVVVKDLGSQNGFLKNGETVTTISNIAHGDIISLGQTVLVFKDPTEIYLANLESKESDPKIESIAKKENHSKVEKTSKQRRPSIDRFTLFAVAIAVLSAVLVIVYLIV